jgi:4-alpha-glucanotransferase
MTKRGLRELARLHGVQTSYRDAGGTLRTARDEPLLKALSCLGVPVQSLDDVRDALRDHRRCVWRRALEPVSVAAIGSSPELLVRLPAAAHTGAFTLTVQTETGDAEAKTEGRLEAIDPVDAEDLDGERFIAVRVQLGRPLPPGYHRATLALPAGEHHTTILSTPPRAYAPKGRATPLWGVFAPLYGLRSERSRGMGDLGDLGAAIEWVRGLGGGMVATLPLCAAFPGEPSPYTPLSRLFWNEIYLDLQRIPEAKAALARDDNRAAIAKLRAGELFDPAAQTELVHRVLDEALPALERDSARRQALTKWLATHPHAEAYARFRAAHEQAGKPWRSWGDKPKGGTIGEQDADTRAIRRHLFAQLLFAEQLAGCDAAASAGPGGNGNGRGGGHGLYLDFPLGVSGDGFDTWRFRDAFMEHASAGAPPDPFFTKGQTWGFPPLHPDGVRQEGYAYVAAALRAHLEHAGVLRLDHVMWLYRLFIVPDGLEPKEGVYIRYRDEELHAVLCIESQRHKSVIVGEDLGTVPPAVKASMAKHDLHGLYVVEYELPGTSERRPLRPPPRRTMASVNTHDMPMWAAYWAGDDIEDRKRDGLLDDAGVEKERAAREEQRRALVAVLRTEGELPADVKEPDARTVLGALLLHLGKSPARAVLVNLEDLWSERRPQNVPGTGPERANWRRPLRLSLEELKDKPEVVATLRALDEARNAVKQ